MSALKPIVKRGRYILGEDEGGFGIWDVRAGDEPIERFPLTAEGFDAAEVRLVEVRRLRRDRLGTFSRVVWVAVLIGVGTWVLAGALLAVFAALGLGGLEFGAASQVIYSIDQLGYRVSVGAALVLATFLLQRWSRKPRPQDAATDPAGVVVGEQAGPFRDSTLLRAILWGMALWLVGGVAVQALYRGGVISFEPPERSTWVIVASVIDALGFRVWVGALIVLGLRRLDHSQRGAQPAAD